MIDFDSLPVGQGVYCFWNMAVTPPKGYVGLGAGKGGIKARASQHPRNARKGSTAHPHFYNALRKYGEEVWEVEVLALAPGAKLEQLKQLERHWIAQLGATDSKKGYNLTPGGEGVFGEGMNEGVRVRHKTAMERRSQNPEWKAKHKAICQRWSQDPEWKAKHIAAIKRRSQDPEWRAKNKAKNQQLSQNPEWKAKNKAKNQQLSQNPEWRAKNKAMCQRRSQDPKWRANHKAAIKRRSQNPEWRAKNKAVIQHRFQDPEWRAKLKVANQRRGALQRSRKLSDEEILK